MIVLKKDTESNLNLDAYCYDTMYKAAIYSYKEFVYGKDRKEAINNLIVVLCKEYKLVYTNKFK